jgi:O-antigen/teichoic acid export membrane protein
VVTIYLAYNGFGVWALVTMNLLTAFIPAVVYWFTNKWCPILVFSRKSFKELFNFGFFMFLSNLINVFCNNIQGLLIGRIYNPATMGYYSKAKSTEEMASTSVSDILGRVTYPVFAEYQNDKKMLVNIIKRMTLVVAYITFPMMFLLMMLAKPIFMLLYSERWIDSVPYFQILCFAGIATCLQVFNYNVIAAIGKSRITFRWTIIKRIVGICFIVSGLALWGLKGLLGGMVVSSWFIYFVNVFLCDKYVGYKFIDQVKDLAPILILSVTSAIVPFGLALVLPSLNMYLIAIFQLIVFIIIYWCGSVLFKMESYQYFVESLPLILGRFKMKSK